MLTPNQEKYILTIPEEKTVSIKPFDPKVKPVAEEIIRQIKKISPDLEVFFGGAAALGIAGPNDVDLNLLSTPKDYHKYLPALISLYGEPTNRAILWLSGTF